MVPNFRAWDEIDKFIKSVHSINFHDKVVILQDRVGCRVQRLFTDVKLMQSTGLKDKNGVEIFEGDILKTRTRGFVVVEKQDGNTMVEYESATNRITIVTLSYFMDMYKVVVAGNIYENKELLEV